VRRALVSCLLLVAACNHQPANAIDVTIVADATVTPAMLASVRTLTIAVSGVQAKSKPYPLPAGMPKQETVQLLPTVTSGALAVTITATDAHAVPVAQGMKSVTITGGQVR
jgi:hypothetical protein